MNYKRLFFYTILGIFLFTTQVGAVTGAIDTSATNTAKVCKDVTCTSPTPGIINFELTAVPSIVIDSVSGISGYVWGNELGWILLNPTGAGVTFANTTTGLLTGKAWSQVSGWINFAPTGQSVSINPTTGEFSGWAWTGGPYGGWIKFDCGDSSTCVRTTWRPSASSGGSGGGGGGGAMLIDVCPNITDAQQIIPAGYTINASGDCVLVQPDLCPNIPGEQPVLPNGYSHTAIGACIVTHVDFCSNIAGKQNTVPAGYIVRANGQCVPRDTEDMCATVPGVQTSYAQCKKEEVVDSCPNVPGVQASVPAGYTQTAGNCFPQTYDICPNIDGTQVSVPNSYTIGANGDCVFLPADLCTNLAGYQNEVPKGFHQEGLTCIFEGQYPTGTTIDGSSTRVVAFSFVPKSIVIPSDNILLKTVVKLFDKTKEFSNTNAFQVDLVSAGITVLGILSLCLFFLLLFRFLRRR